MTLIAEAIVITSLVVIIGVLFYKLHELKKEDEKFKQEVIQAFNKTKLKTKQ